MRSSTRLIALRTYFALAALEGLAACVAFLLMPHDPANAWLLGYSRSRLLLIALTFGTTLILAALAWRTWTNASFAERLTDWLPVLLRRSELYTAALILSGLLLLTGFYAYNLSNQLTDNLIRVRLERLSPLLLWLMALSLQTLIALPLLRFREERKGVKPSKAILKCGLIIFVVFIVLASLMAVTRLGLEPDRVGWDNPGAPLLPVQVVLAVLVGLVVWGLVELVRMERDGDTPAKFLWGRIPPLDILLCIVIWLAAFVVWTLEPVSSTYFSPDPQPPNFEIYPYSDAGLHDIAGQNLIIGEGYTPVAEKPLYSMLLGLAHVVFGQKYSTIILLQILILAVFPTLVFLLAKLMHNRLTGLIVAGLLIFREQNTLALSHKIRVSHSKLLMTDLPAAFGMALFVLLLMWWLQKREERRVGALISGGALGVLMLVRSQAILLVPVVLVALLIILWRQSKPFLESSALFVAGFVLAVLPWMVRNYLVSGQFGYSQPNQALYIAKQYSLTPEDADPGFPTGATRGEYVELGFAKMLAFTRQYPGVVAEFVTAHFLRNLVDTVLIFHFRPTDVAYGNHGPPGLAVDPFVWVECCSLDTYLDSVPYWGEWRGMLAAGTQIPILLNLAVLALGIGVAWRRMRWAGMIPLAIFLVYDLSVAIARVSGWRLILPVDWIAILYYCVGLGQLMLWGLSYLSNSRLGEAVENESQMSLASRFPVKSTLGFGALILFVGLSVPLAETLFPERYIQPSKEVALARLEEINGGMPLDAREFLTDEEAVVLSGRALYPKFYIRNKGEPGGKWTGYEINSYSRLAFYLAGPDNAYVVLPIRFPPDPFPNASDVLVFGCQVEGHVEAVVVVVLGRINEVFVGEQEGAMPCGGRYRPKG